MTTQPATTTELLDDPAEYKRLLEEAAASVKARLGRDIPKVLVVAGSGLGAFAESVLDAQSASYDQFKHFPVSTVVGHAGKLVWGTVGGKPVLVMSGRKHLYEGVDVREATLPLRALLLAGVKTVILSNAAGALNRQFRPGDLMLIDDHINNQYRNPLMGANLDFLGPRFPDMSAPYDRDLMALTREIAVELGIALRQGTYVANMGPTYETQAEVGMLRQFADAVGMSTVPEQLVATHAGAKVLGISVITNTLVLRTDAVTTHDEVMETGRAVGETFCRLVAAVIQRLPEDR
ncbi:MAG: purine-nucleoside phosphorylase [Sumerlaeia bacterium]